MPIYEYVCKKCGAHFEVLTTSSMTEAVKCSKCESLNVVKTISAATFRMGGGASSSPSGCMSGCGSRTGFS